jgi:hypothetical protein
MDKHWLNLQAITELEATSEALPPRILLDTRV